MGTEEETNKTKSLTALVLGIIGVPFIVTLVKFLRKGPDELVKMKDLMAIFGVQLLFLILTLIYVLFFFHPVARLG